MLLVSARACLCAAKGKGCGWAYVLFVSAHACLSAAKGKGGGRGWIFIFLKKGTQ